MRRRVLILLVLVSGALVVESASGAVVTLPNAPDYEWHYGCSPTAAGMMIGYYDLNGYDGKNYSNLVPGGVAELSTFGSTDALAKDMIASQGHIDDFYSGGDNASGDDDVSEPFHDFDSLADFMGTSQDSVGNSNGETTFWYYTNGEKTYAENVSTWEYSEYGDDSGMYGLGEYVEYAGYETEGYGLYNQCVDGYQSGGFTFDEYVAEIEAGRPVMIHVEGHSMFGYGYDDDTSDVILHDTWNEGEHRMSWGGAYSGLDHLQVTVMEISGGSVIPEPGAVIVWSLLGMIGLTFQWQRRRNTA